MSCYSAAHAADMRMHQVRVYLPPGPPHTSPFMTRNVSDSREHGGGLAACMGFLTLLSRLERQYHSHVRSRKRNWLLSHLDECVALFHSCPRQFWRTFRGPPSPLPLPLHNHELWDTFMNTFIGVGLDPTAAPLEPLSDVAYPPAHCPPLVLTTPSLWRRWT